MVTFIPLQLIPKIIDGKIWKRKGAINLKYDVLYETVKAALELQQDLLAELNTQIIKVKGYLIIRESGDHKLYYRGIKIKTRTGWRTKSKNITGSTKLIKALARKGLNKKLRRIYEKNIKTLTAALDKYIPLTSDVLMPEKYREFLVENSNNGKYITFPFDPLVHIHATVCGIMVRSKGEVIIANALWHYGIPFVYEELFPYQGEDGKWYYPDFTIHLPDGRRIIWEHWGMLDKHSYCVKNADKLYTYNKNGFILGKNFIITQDDVNGACDSAFIYHIIEQYILPYFN